MFCQLLPLVLHTDISREQSVFAEWEHGGGGNKKKATFSTPAQSALACSTLRFPQGFVCSVVCTGLKLSTCNINCSVGCMSPYICIDMHIMTRIVLKLFCMLLSMNSSNYVQKASPVL